MSYATAQDVINRYPNRDLVQLTNEDPAATTINVTPITQALSDASAEIDGYIEGRFSLPLTDPSRGSDPARNRHRDVPDANASPAA